MKIYVDELPKNCNDCELGYFYDCQYCSLRPDLARKDEWCEKEKHCPLLSAQSLKQQVREEVVEEIREKFNKKVLYVKIDGLYSHVKAIKFDDVNKILDQVKGENNVKD